jgi:3-methyladenine DNA glycosylase/8-oxoguanine DNA glycosylase
VPTEREVEAIGEKWRPNRSLASFYLWASGRQAAKPARRKPTKSASR